MRERLTARVLLLDDEDRILLMKGRLPSQPDAPGAWSGIGFDPLGSLNDPHPANRSAMLGPWGFIVAEVPAGELRSFNYAYCFHLPGTVTAGLATRYYYTRWFDSLLAVGEYALSQFDEAVQACAAADQRLARSALSEAQRFTVAHTTRSYLYSTQLLEHEGLCVGGSTGINVAGAIRLARQLGPGHTIVTVLCDSGYRYQSKLFNPEFMRSKNLPVPEWLEKKSKIDVPFEKV